MLGLLTPTDPRWIDAALENLDAVLVDHLHCELKAASNATALVARYPANGALVRGLTALAQEELSHVTQVFDALERRGVRPHPPDRDPYASALRQAASLDGAQPRASGRDGKRGDSAGHPGALLDRLAIAALIEARSCERFSILKDHAPTAEMRAWYAELFASEARHYRLFAALAEDTAGEHAARARIARLAEREAEIVAGLPLLARVH